MKRCALILLALLLLSVVASSLAYAEVVTLKVWHWNQPVRWKFYEPFIAKFEKENGVKIEAEMKTWAELREKLVASIAGGVAPDVCFVSSSWGDEIAEKGAFLDLAKLVNRDKEGAWKADYSAVFPTAFQLWKNSRGEQYAFPFDFDLAALFYNKELFDAAGLDYPNDEWTWDDFFKAAQTLTRDTNGDGLPDQYGVTTGMVNLWPELVWANGGSLLTADGTKPNLNTPEARQALEFYAKLLAHKVNNLWDVAECKRLGSPDPPTLFKAGKIGMMPVGAWGPSVYMYDSDKGKYVMDFDVAHMPKSPKGKRAVLMQGQGVSILAGSKNVEVAWKFVKYMASVEVQTMSGRDLGQFPIRRDVALTEAFLVPDKPPQNKKVFVEVAAYAHAWPKVPNWSAAWKVMNSEIAKYASGSQSLDAALANIDKLVPPTLSSK